MKNMFRLILVAMLAATLGLVGCSGDDGAQGPPGAPGQDVTAQATPESCANCHADSGDYHQAEYNTTHDPSKIVLAFGAAGAASSVDNGDATFTTTVPFTVTDNGLPSTASLTDATSFPGVDTQTWKVTSYDPTTRLFTDLSPTGLVLNGAAGSYTLTFTLTEDITAEDSFVYGYLVRGKVGPAAGHAQLYDDVSNAAVKFGTWTYTSGAKVSGCEKCHGTPYLKHGYRAAAVAGIDDFVACKACHGDNVAGHGGFNTQLGTGYIMSIINDTHASHANEFEYPQSIKTCDTCHNNGDTLVAANFKATTCWTCHNADPAAVQGSVGVNVPTFADIIPATHPYSAAQIVADPTIDCTTCHVDGGALAFASIHTGYDPKIYGSDGAGGFDKYSNNITVSVDSANYTAATGTIDLGFGAAGTFAGLDSANIVPTIQVALYGYNTKDFIRSNHDRDANGNRMGEFTLDGTGTSPYFSNEVDGTGTWTVTYTLPAEWAALIADGTVDRAEIAILPTLDDASGNAVALNAVSKTFSFGDNAFVAAPTEIVTVADGCNKCHDALATTFHSPNRGGSITVCRMCHVVGSGGSHLEMQSRSIDSYVHAIHSNQQFDVKNIDFTDPAQAAAYEEGIGFFYPMFSLTNCESCHLAGTYNVPDQSKSMPGVLSASAVNTTWDRAIGTVPSYITGPATRACGACHRAQMINEDDANGLAAFYEHTATNGYLLDPTTNTLDDVTKTIMTWFK